MAHWLIHSAKAKCSSENALRISWWGVRVHFCTFDTTIRCSVVNWWMFLCRKLRQTKHFQMMWALCTTLLLLVAVFLSGTERSSKSEGLCLAFALVTHYLLLSVFCWMSSIATLLYIQLVKVFGGITGRVMKILIVMSLGKWWGQNWWENVHRKALFSVEVYCWYSRAVEDIMPKQVNMQWPSHSTNKNLFC